MAKRKKLYEAGMEGPFRLSRSKVELYRNCPRCFYLDRRLGIGRPPGFPFNLNSAVDGLLKNEFDRYRAAGEPHPYMLKAGLDAVPFAHADLDRWRHNFTGIAAAVRETPFEFFGAVDDVWIDNASGELLIVDYKATSKNSEVTLDAPWQLAYKRQMEFYQWLFRRNGHAVSKTGYFVYCNGDRARKDFQERLEFSVKVIPYAGDDAWVEPTAREIHELLESAAPPPATAGCEYCGFAKEAVSAG
ncbi:MAG: PD-(D/E)XK nuclease family protein [Myxococcota bacterium]|nr:PD-(D/E)XK nuclease family protein [Myxococcota bacterium]MDP7298602.1 PD-(D/E)XK nuclease family protein [Myxococcota bacterium]MDP7434194.1 PD-(D/E)XK nuclease family protein [Myxococcota bacterium]HJO24555.1 PD-(D/E)XK nuclease family protein [Myxococcota bacterium]